MNNRFLIFSLLFSFLFFSCKTAKEVGEVKLKKKSPENLLEEIDKNKIVFEWFSGKAKVNYSDEKHSQSFTANIRMKKDSAIYASLTSLMGVEVAKILITPDSIFIIDRLNKAYYSEPFNYILNYVPFPVSIQNLQDIILGNPLMTAGNKMQSKIEKGLFQFTVENENITSTISVNPVVYSLSTEHLLDKQLNRSLTLVFNDYKTTDNTEFSYQREINFKGERETNMEIKFSRLKLNEPQTFPFFISDKYENRF